MGISHNEPNREGGRKRGRGGGGGVRGRKMEGDRGCVCLCERESERERGSQRAGPKRAIKGEGVGLAPRPSLKHPYHSQPDTHIHSTGEFIKLNPLQ